MKLSKLTLVVSACNPGKAPKHSLLFDLGLLVTYIILVVFFRSSLISKTVSFVGFVPIALPLAGASRRTSLVSHDA